MSELQETKNQWQRASYCMRKTTSDERVIPNEKPKRMNALNAFRNYYQN